MTSNQQLRLSSERLGQVARLLALEFATAQPGSLKADALLALRELRDWRAACTGKHGSQQSCVESSRVETSALRPVVECKACRRPFATYQEGIAHVMVCEGSPEEPKAHHPDCHAMRCPPGGCTCGAVKASSVPLREPQPDDFWTCGMRDWPAYKAAHDEWKRKTSENGNGK